MDWLTPDTTLVRLKPDATMDWLTPDTTLVRLKPDAPNLRARAACRT
jgi:hypothetical protein